MQPKILRNDVAEYTSGHFDGTDTSGMRVIGEMVLVLCDQVKEQTQGGVFIAEDIRERHELAAETGILIRLGDGAFKWNADKTRPWTGYVPQVGDHVFMARYSGAVFTGDDGQRYRVMEYTCIAAVADRPIERKEAS
ncbi:MAG: hypothetical protein WDN46_10335 [Methylocella sp.]